MATFPFPQLNTGQLNPGLSGGNSLGFNDLLQFLGGGRSGLAGLLGLFGNSPQTTLPNVFGQPRASNPQIMQDQMGTMFPGFPGGAGGALGTAGASNIAPPSLPSFDQIMGGLPSAPSVPQMGNMLPGFPGGAGGVLGSPGASNTPNFGAMSPGLTGASAPRQNNQPLPTVFGQLR